MKNLSQIVQIFKIWIRKHSLVAIIIGFVLYLLWNSQFSYLNSSVKKLPLNTAIPTPTLENQDVKAINQLLNDTPTPSDTYRYQTETPAPTDTPTPTRIPTPTEQSYQPQSKSCYQSGDYTFCSDGSSYITSGSSTYINGGTNGKSGSCTTSGSYTNCSDGSSAIQNGSYSSSYGNGKSVTCIQNGAWTNCSDGSSTYNANYK